MTLRPRLATGLPFRYQLLIDTKDALNIILDFEKRQDVCNLLIFS